MPPALPPLYPITLQHGLLLGAALFAALRSKGTMSSGAAPSDRFVRSILRVEAYHTESDRHYDLDGIRSMAPVRLIGIVA